MMIRLEIEGTPPSLNQWTTLHWSQQQQIKKDWAWLVKAACLTAKAGRPEYKLATVHIALVFPVVRRRDLDNYAPKAIMDGLVNAGILQDDRNDWVKVTWAFAKGLQRKTIIDIAAVES
ncbi:MAG: hypothetical protein H6Q76_755 [Firmicutes bacterium]|nr:hypothetical protein [Bacillota bacterium]